MVFAFLLILPIFLIIGVVIAAVFFRAAISLANKVFKETPNPSRATIDSPTDFLAETPAKQIPAASKPSNSISNNQPTDSNPYAAPQNYASPVRANGTIGLAIPEPSFGKACGIAFLHNFALLVISILFGMMGLGEPIDSLVGILVGFVLAVFLYGSMLPTTPGRAAVIYLFQLLLMLAVGVGIAAVVLTISALAG